MLVATEPIAASPPEINAGLMLANSGFSLSPDGHWLTFGTTKGQGYVDLTTGRMANAETGWAMSYVVPVSSWSPTDEVLALRIHREGKDALTLWPAGAPAEAASVRELVVFPRKLYPQFPVIWASDGKTVYYIINQNLPSPKSDPKDDHPPTQSKNVSLQLAGDYKIDHGRERFEREYPEAYAERNRSLIMATEVATGRTGVLAKGNDIDSIHLSPDGSRLTAVQIRRNPKRDPAGDWLKQRLGDVYLVEVAKVAELPSIDLEKMEDRKAGWSDSAGQRLRPILADLGINGTFGEGRENTHDSPLLAWSPDGTRLSYATVGKQSTGDVYVYEIATRQARNLTEMVRLKPTAKLLGYGENRTHVYDSRKFGNSFNPMWLPDGEAIVALGKGDVWLIPLNGPAQPQNLTEKFSQQVTRILPSVNPAVAAVDATGRLTLVAKERASRYDSVWKLDPGTGQITHVANTGVWTGLTLASDRELTRLYYSGQSINSASNIYRLEMKDGSGNPPQPEFVTKFKLELAMRKFPESRVLEWKTPDGYIGFGLLYLPVGASKKNKVPLIFDGFPAQDSSQVDIRANFGARFYNDSLDSLLREGFAVLFADIPMSDDGVYEHPMKQMVDGVNAAVETALTTGVIDETRMGIMGTGLGGSMVNAVITQTNRFKAAASISGLSDWFAYYMATGEGLYFELGGGRFGKPLWDEPERYVENSPIRYWNRVSTPLLIVHGEWDPVVPVRFAWETFNGLYYQNKTGIFAAYPRMGGRETVEARQRIRGWFREHLLGGPPVTQMADQGSFFFGGNQPGDAPANPSMAAPAVLTVPTQKNPPGPALQLPSPVSTTSGN